MRWSQSGVSLSTKAVVALVAALFTVASLLTLVQYRISTRNLLAGWEAKAAQEARVLGVTAEPLVLSGDHRNLRRVVAQAGLLPDVHTLTVVNAGGTILASLVEQEVGQPLRFHPNGLRQALEDARQVRWIEAGRKGRVQYHLIPLQVETPPAPRVIGAVLIGIDLSTIDAMVQKNLRGLLVVNGIAFSALLLLFWAAIRIGVIRPLAVLTRAMRSMPATSVATPLPVTSSDEIGLLTEAFNQMTEALQRKDHQARESLGSLRQREFTLTVLNEAIQAAVAADDLPTFYQSTVSRLVQLFEVEMGCIQTVDADGNLTLQFQAGMPMGLVASLEDLAVARAVTGPVITSRRAATHDLTAGALTWDAARMDGIRYVCVAPILDRDTVLGTLMLATRRARPPSPNELELFSTVALEVGAAMSRQRAEQAVREALAATEQERTRLDTLYETAPIGLLYVTPELVVERVNRFIAELHGRAVEDFPGKALPELIPAETWSTMSPIFERVLQTGEPYRGFEEEFSDPRAPGPSRYFSSDFHPDRQADGSLRGILVVVHDITAHKEAERDRALFLKERESYLKELEAKNLELKELAVRDPLTGLYNHRYFEEALAQEWRRFQRTGEPFTVLVMDVDAFKTINDRYGHDAGDRALRQVGATLSASLRETDLLARTGGDEFVALLPRTDKNHGKAVLEKVGAALKELRLTTPEGSVKLAISMGHATIPGFPPVTSAAELVRAADQRMYEAKRLASSGKADAS